MEFLSKNDLDALWIKIKGTFGMSLDVSGSNMRLLGKEIVSNSWQDKVLASVSQATARTWLGWNEKMEASARGTTVASLENGKIPLAQIPDAVLGQMLFGGTVNSSGVATLTANVKSKLGITDNTVQLVNAAGTSSTYGWVRFEGVYFVMSEDSSFAGLPLQIGDWLISTGTMWGKIDNTDAVTSVCGLTGAVTTDQVRSALQLGTAATHAHTDYVTDITYDSTNLKLKQSKGGGTATDIVQFGSNAFTSTAYLPLTGGEIYNSNTNTPLTIKGPASQGACIKFTNPWSGASGSYDGIFGIDQDGYFKVDPRNTGTFYDVLHSGNSSVSKSGQTLTVKINDVSCSLENITYTIASGDNNGQIKVTPSSGSAYNVSVTGLGARAFDSTDYLPLTGGTLFDDNGETPLTIMGDYQGQSATSRSLLMYAIKREQGYDPLYGKLGMDDQRELLWVLPHIGTGGEEVYNVLHSGNSSVAKNGSTLTVKINGTELSLTDTNTTYTIASGDGNGQIKVTPSSGSAYNVSVTGLGARAFDSTDYLPLTGGKISKANTICPLTIEGVAQTGAYMKFSAPWSGASGSYDGILGVDGDGYFKVDPRNTGTFYDLLHSGNTSLSVSPASGTPTSFALEVNGTSVTVGEIGSAYINSLS